MKPIHSLYFHFPYCRHMCNYCDFYKTVSSDSDFSKMENSLISDFVRHQEFLKAQGFYIDTLETLYLGGGTPSLWGASGVKFFKDLIKILEVTEHQKIKVTFHKAYYEQTT